MTTTKTTKTTANLIKARIAALRAEMTDAYTVSLGAAAVKCVRESLDAWEAEAKRVGVAA